MPFDYEAIQKRHLESQQQLKIGIVGFGNFGQFLAKRILDSNHTVIAFSRSDYHRQAENLGVTYFRDADDFCEEHPDVVILATSILSTDAVLRSLPLQRLKRNTLFVDVLSVKEFPKNLFLHLLPPHFDILCTHPMFGPESGKGSWGGLPFVFDRVRVQSHKSNQDRCARLLQVFEKELNNLERAFDDVKKQLFGQLHDVLRSQLFVANIESRAAALSPALALPPPSNGSYASGSPTSSHIQSDEESESSGSEGLGDEKELRNAAGGRRSEAVQRE